MRSARIPSGPADHQKSSGCRGSAPGNHAESVSPFGAVRRACAVYDLDLPNRYQRGFDDVAETPRFDPCASGSGERTDVARHMLSATFPDAGEPGKVFFAQPA